MSITEYLNTAGGIVWTAACVPLGILLAWLAVFVINKVPAKWLCDYGETPSDELLNGKRVFFQKEGMIMSVIFAAALVMCRLQFNRGFDIYFIVLSLIMFLAVMISVCDIKYTIIPDQFTAAVGILGAAVSIYDIARGFKILHFAWWSPLLGIAIGGGAMLVIDLIGMLVYKKDGIGFGDVKLFAAVGVLTGFPGTIYTFIISLITATICFVIMIAVSKIRAKNKKTDTETETSEVKEELSEETEEISEVKEETSGSEEAISGSSYLAFGPYIAAALMCYVIFLDTVNYLVNLYLELF